ncbi:Holliday junction resolvase RuvX [Kocuria tytonicola]|uniref:Putative pre-16S rRNA nuclease n=1 Tax=Kocuria tytonicola TaxID=2055946 RepID=A0A3L9L7X6_9MICC|nr:Holliday junction resolvase RuvX [Kocuria tytonicola]RLY95003.1 Holliday junction resolvase RuvX [Kocuria tytonicola]
MPEAFERGVRMGVDVGQVRVGIALTDPDCVLATPHQTLTRDPNPRKAFDVKIITRLCEERDVRTVYVGLPRSLDGGENRSTEMARDYAASLLRRLGSRGCTTSVRLVDERLSTVTAHQSLLDSGVSRRHHMDRVDQAAAVTFLQTAVDHGVRSGTEPGEQVHG